MEKLWAGRFKSALDGAADDFNASIRVDARMYREDIEGSQAHVRMLGACGIVTEAEAERILRALGEIRAELDDGRFLCSGGSQELKVTARPDEDAALLAEALRHRSDA